jgi:hypothetical protein
MAQERDRIAQERNAELLQKQRLATQLRAAVLNQISDEIVELNEFTSRDVPGQWLIRKPQIRGRYRNKSTRQPRPSSG